MNLDEIRIFVRTQLDLDETDLPNLLLDLYVQDGYDRIIELEDRWPFFETLWDIAVVIGENPTMPIDAASVESLMAPDGHRIWRVDQRWAEDNYVGAANGTPTYWSQVNRTIVLSPRSNADVTLHARGFRKPTDWIAGGASSEVDADDRLHLPICWYACSVGYAQQEDEVLEQTYMNRYREAVSVARTSVMRPWSGSPKILNGTRFRTGAPPYSPSQVIIQSGGTA